MKRLTFWLTLVGLMLVAPPLVANMSPVASTQGRQKQLIDKVDAPFDNGYRSPSSRHKVKVTDRDLMRTVKSSNARVIAEYDSFILVDADIEAADQLAATRQAEVRDDFNVIMLNSGAVDTTSQSAIQLQRSGAGRDGGGRQLHLVQFPGPIKPEWYDALDKTGAEIVTYIPNNAYLVYGDEASLRRIQRAAQRDGLIQWEAPYSEQMKLDPVVEKHIETARLISEGITVQSKDPSNPGLYAIQLVKDPATNFKTLDLIDDIKTSPIVNQFEILKYVNVVVPMSASNLTALSARPDVVSVQPYVMPKRRDERQNQIIAGNLTGSAPTAADYLAYLAGKGFTQAQFTSSGFAVDVSDDGLDNGLTAVNNPFLKVGGIDAGATRVVYNRIENSGGPVTPGRTGFEGHGNLNTHIIGGFIPFGFGSGFPHADAAGFRFGLGVAPFVRVGHSAIFNPGFTNPNYANLQSRAYQDGARISSNSWGASVGGAYTIDSQAYDALVRDAQPASSVNPTAGNQQMVILFAAGNDGSGANTVGTPGTGKNVITVGAAENVHSHSTANGGDAASGADGCGITDTGANNANDIIGFSSRGPCDDGRIKPDIVAPGTHVTGGVAQQAPPQPANGLAIATFNAVGVCALSLWDGSTGNPSNFFPLGQQWYTTSSGTSHSTPAVAGAAALVRQHFLNSSLPAPSPAMTKAILVNAARYMNGVGANDNLFSNSQGMGEVDFNSYFDIFAASSILRDQDGADTFTASGQQRVITGNVDDNSKPFRVTLAWTDAPGPTSGNAFVNNLDLEVTVGGQTFKGNVFTGANSVTGGSADTRNNLESVFVPAGVTGPFVVKVIATNIAGDGVPNSGGALDQDYALVIRNGEATSQAVIASAGATIVTEGCDPANGALDPGETVTVSLCVQNVGAINTTSLVGTLQGTGGVTSPSGPQNYGVVVAGGPAVCRNFTFTASGACGGTLTATLALQDGATNLGTVTYNFTLGVLTVATSQNFDGVGAPALPGGWTASTAVVNGASTAWVTSAAGTPAPPADTAPNAAFTNDPATVSDERLDSPSIAIVTSGAQLSFRNNFDLEASTVNPASGFDGGVLEISIGGGAFQDIIVAGGSFVAGGYNRTISATFSNPLAARQAWSGNSAGFITTTVNLPAAAAGQNIVLRFRRGTDTSVGDVGWRIDTISISDGYDCCSSVEPCIVTCPANVAVSNDPNQCGAVVNYAAPTTAGDCGTVTCSPASGSFFPVGVTTVTCTEAGGGGGGGCVNQTITHSSSQAITALNSVSCNSVDGHVDNSYWRAFSLPSFSIAGEFNVTSVDIGIEQATSGAGGSTAGAKTSSSIRRNTSRSKATKTKTIVPLGGGPGQTITVRLHRTTGGTFPTGARTLIASADFIIADQTGTILNLPIGASVPAGSELIVEVFTPNGEGAGNLFFIGSNSAGETGPSYISAPDCGITNPTPTSSIGFPEMQIVMNVNGCEGTGGGGGSECSFTVTVNDTQPPSVTCPANVTATTPQNVCNPAGGGSAVVNFTATGSDNCPGVTVACVPPSGSSFPVGTTTVTCTATDAAGNTATCSFTVSTFDVCLQDNSNPATKLIFNSTTGEYRFCCGGTTYSGTGTIQKQGCIVTLTHNTPTRRVTGKADKTQFKGTASIQSPPGVIKCTLADADIRNNACVCGQ